MDMDKAPLNRAHQLQRKADLLNRHKKFDECIECHQEAVELYKKCLTLSNNKSALESIQLQKEWNERQIRMLQLKKSYLERAERERKINGIVSSKHSQKDVVENLEAKIFRTIETHDSLICYLGQRGIIDTNERQCHSTIEETEEKEGSPQIVGNKHPKDDSTVIEELKVLSGQLRESVQGNLDKTDGLLIQLDDRNKEIEQLKSYIKELEFEKTSKEDDPKDILKVATDSSEETSPYVFSPITELSPGVTDLASLPSLEPLQLPDFDISKLKQFSVPEVSSRLLRKDK